MTPMHRPLWQRFLLFLVPLMLSNSRGLLGHDARLG